MEIPKGLTSDEVEKRISRYGLNKLPEKPPPGNLKIILGQIKSPLVYVLFGASIVTISLAHYLDSVVILFAVFINTVLGFLQEKKASNALHALKKLLTPKAKVIRNGVEVVIDSTEVVPGEICVLVSGGKVPADGKVIDAKRLTIDESLLTGESYPVVKNSENEIYMGTTVVGGGGIMLVEKTGSLSRMGKIALTASELDSDTPLKKQIVVFANKLSQIVLLLTVAVFAIGILQGKNWVDIFTTSVALAVSAIPEGLLVGMTVVLAVGMQRILMKKGLVQSLLSAETLGSVTTICTDKTGTLTEGKLKVVNSYGRVKEIAAAAIAGVDKDDPLGEVIIRWAKSEIADWREIKTSIKLLDYIPFDPSKKYYLSLLSRKSKKKLFLSGAPEIVLSSCDINLKEKKGLLNLIKKYAQKGQRIIGFAERSVEEGGDKIKDEHINKGYKWLGFLVFSDKVRESVKDSLIKTMKAGIKLIVITGDNRHTAAAVMKELGLQLNEEDVIEGSALERMASKEISIWLARNNNCKLFARTTPEQKLKIVEALKSNGEVVAMFGDGVNDALALKKSDIGVVVSEATDVAKESSDLILLNSSFNTIVAAVEEGRGMFENIRKIILYLMCDAFGEMIAVVGALILSVPLPLSAAQILWINLVSDGFPHLALTIDPKRKNIMKEPPKRSNEAIVSGWMKILIFIVSIVAGISGLVLFIYYYFSTKDLRLASSIAFAAFGINSLVYVFSIRNIKEPFWVENPFQNKWLNVAVLVGFILQLMPFAVPFLRDSFKLAVLEISHWAVISLVTLLMFVVVESVKLIYIKNQQ